MTEKTDTLSGTYLEPIGDNIIGKVHVPEDKTPSGIILPDQVNQDKGFLEVVAVGPEVEASIDSGDVVLRKPYTGTPIEVDNEEYVVLEEVEIAAIVREA